MPYNSCRVQTDERPSMLEGRHFGPDPELRSGPASSAPPCDRGPANEARRPLRIRSFQFFYPKTRFLQQAGRGPINEQAAAVGFYSQILRVELFLHRRKVSLSRTNPVLQLS